jgi:predicted nucleic acid-binding protein
VIYLDSCILIYAIEDESARGTVIRQRLAAAGAAGVAISPLVILECLVGPLRERNLPLRDHYNRAFDRFTVLPSGTAEFIRAAELRADSSLRTPDALHLATAQLAGCNELWTNDSRLTAASRGLAIDVSG